MTQQTNDEQTNSPRHRAQCGLERDSRMRELPVHNSRPERKAHERHETFVLLIMKHSRKPFARTRATKGASREQNRLRRHHARHTDGCLAVCYQEISAQVRRNCLRGDTTRIESRRIDETARRLDEQNSTHAVATIIAWLATKVNTYIENSSLKQDIRNASRPQRKLNATTCK